MFRRILRKVPLLGDFISEEPIFITPQDDLHSLFVPSYDYATQVITKWVKTWKISNVLFFQENQASYNNAIKKLNDSNGLNRVIAFVGHGSPSELLTDPDIGKKSVSAGHGCLMDCGDLANGLSGIQLVAWACNSGQIFGGKVSACSQSAFIGFDKEIVMLINPESEALWSNLIKDLISRIAEKHQIELNDEQWLKERISNILRDISSGKIDTGSYNAANRVFLKRIAKSVRVYIGGA